MNAVIMVECNLREKASQHTSTITCTAALYGTTLVTKIQDSRHHAQTTQCRAKSNKRKNCIPLPLWYAISNKNTGLYRCHVQNTRHVERFLTKKKKKAKNKKKTTTTKKNNLETNQQQKKKNTEKKNCIPCPSPNPNTNPKPLFH